MAYVQKTRVQDALAGSGTGDLTITGSAPTGQRTIASVMSDGDTAVFMIVDRATSTWEEVDCTYNSMAGTLTRNTVHDGTSGPGTKVTFGSGTKDVFMVASASRVVTLDNAKGPTVTTITTVGSGTYTTPAGAKWLRVRMSAGGGGGAGCGATTHTAGNAGGDTTFNSIVAKSGGGGDGTFGIGGAGGTGGSGTVDLRVPGITAFSVWLYTTTQTLNGPGADSPWFGSGNPPLSGAVNTPASPVANTGAGGNGGGSGNNSPVSGGGGGSGECCELIIRNPSISYSYTLGDGGVGGTGTGTGGANGAKGAAGIIIVEEHYV